MAIRTMMETVTVLSVKRRRNSAYGNPLWFIETDLGKLATKTDASVNYEVENLAPAMTAPGARTRVELERRGAAAVVIGLEVIE